MNVRVVTVELLTDAGACHSQYAITEAKIIITNLGYAGYSMPLSDFFVLHQQ